MTTVLVPLHTSRNGELAVALPSALNPNDALAIRGTVVNLNPTLPSPIPPWGDGAAIYFFDAANNVLLDISIRRTERVLLFNSKPAGGNWGNEERIPLAGIFPSVGVPTTITLVNLADHYKIVFESTAVYSFKKRTGLGGVPTKVQYITDAGISQSLSSPLVVQQLDTLVAA